MKGRNPYSEQPDRAFWKRAIGGRDITEINGLFEVLPGLATAKFATAGSCFAQHLGKALRAHGLSYMDYEPPPPFLAGRVEYFDPPPPFADGEEPGAVDKFGYGVYSCRYGNIYSVRQLFQLFEEAFGRRRPKDAIWTRENRHFDALRPGVEPDGFGSAAEVKALRASHLSRVRALFLDLDVFVFTLGLTEAWVSRRDGTTYPIAPGVIAGQYNPADYEFINFRYNDIYKDMQAFVEGLRKVNPSARLLLTVSPVTLAATASQNHVLVATTYSKSVLRSVAGDLAADFKNVHYFPSYEVITGQPSRHKYYNADLRTVSQSGVNEAMRHFFGAETPAVEKVVQAETKAPVSLVGFEHCEESLLDGAAP